MDVAKSSVDVETHASFIGVLERQVAQIDDALAALDTGTYGICRNCGEEIAFERLKAIPSAIYCADCQTEMSSQAPGRRIGKRSVDGRHRQRRMKISYFLIEPRIHWMSSPSEMIYSRGDYFRARSGG